MIKEKYGKDFNPKKINRDKKFIEEYTLITKKMCEKVHKNGTKIMDCCPMCKSRENIFVAKIFDFEYVECKNCGNVYLKTFPKDVVAMYSKDFSFQYAAYTDENLFKQRSELIAKPKIEFVNQFFEDKEKLQWLDIGCGAGEILYGAKQAGYNVLGYEADETEANLAIKRGLNVKNNFMDINNLTDEMKKDINSADILSIFNVFEHLEFPAEFVYELSRTMKTGAIFVNEMPRHPSLAPFVNIADTEINFRHISPPMHLNIFSEKSVEMVYEKAGLEIIGKWVYGSGFFDLLNYAMLKNPGNIMYEKLLDITNDVQKIVDERGFGDFMLIVARKK